MRNGPIVTRKFCWAITYEASDIDYGKVPPVSLKAVMKSLMAMSRMGSSFKIDNENMSLANDSLAMPKDESNKQ
jgi:hypothetical protein